MSRSTFKSFHLFFDTLIFYFVFISHISIRYVSYTKSQKVKIPFPHEMSSMKSMEKFLSSPHCHEALKDKDVMVRVIVLESPSALESSLSFTKNFTFRLHHNNISIPQSWNHTRTISIVKRLIEGDETLNFTCYYFFYCIYMKEERFNAILTLCV